MRVRRPATWAGESVPEISPEDIWTRSLSGCGCAVRFVTALAAQLSIGGCVRAVRALALRQRMAARAASLVKADGPPLRACAPAELRYRHDDLTRGLSS